MGVARRMPEPWRNIVAKDSLGLKKHPLTRRFQAMSNYIFLSRKFISRQNKAVSRHQSTKPQNVVRNYECEFHVPLKIIELKIARL